MILTVSAVLSAVATVTLAANGNIATKVNPDLCVVSRSLPANNGEPVLLGRCTEEALAIWNYEAGHFRGTSNRCLDVKDGVNENGTPLQTWTCDADNKNQKFEFINSTTIRWVGTSKCIDVTDGKYEPGTQLQIWDCADGNKNQMFTYQTPSPLYLRSRADPALVITASSNTNGAPLIFSTYNQTPGQCFTPADGGYHAFNNTMAIDLKDGDQTKGDLQVWQSFSGNKNQQWVYDNTTGNMKLAVNQKKCVSILVGGGNELRLADCRPGERFQQFTAVSCFARNGEISD